MRDPKSLLDRYPFSVEKGSQSSHCCFLATVVNDEGLNVCECFDEDVARQIAESLNTLALASTGQGTTP